jgi:alkaline phosphatase D
VYDQAVPHYKLATSAGPIYQSFRVGRCQFIMTDLRSKRDKSNQWNYVGKTMMGAEQKAWFKQEILKANADPTVALIFWVTSVPWGGAPASDDHWAAYNDERMELADFFKANSVTRLFLLFGDEHSQSIDDGRHTDWATGTWGSSGSGHGWPSFGVAPMGQSPSSKAGPYFIGQMWMSNPAYQFGLVTVTDTGSDAYVQFRGVYETGDTVNSAGTNMLWQFNGTESPRPI